jgi:hypothetical protein
MLPPLDRKVTRRIGESHGESTKRQHPSTREAPNTKSKIAPMAQAKPTVIGIGDWNSKFLCGVIEGG